MKNVKKLLSALPFVLVFILLVGSVFVAKTIYSKKNNEYFVNTAPTEDGKVYSTRVFKSISSIIAIDFENHSRKKEISSNLFFYNSETTEIKFQNFEFPFGKTVFHIEGESVQPESFCLYDFDGSGDELLVLLNDHEAIKDLEYSYDEKSRKISFRSDINPEQNGKFLIMYHTKDGALHTFGNQGNDDKFSELQWNWLHRTQNAPAQVMKNRSDVSDKKLSKEVGFKIDLPKGDATFISETMENNQKRLSVFRWYYDKDLMVECKNSPFLLSYDVTCVGNMEIIQISKHEFARQKISGTKTAPDGSTSPVQLVVYDWEKKGTNYQLSAEEDKISVAEEFLGKLWN